MKTLTATVSLFVIFLCSAITVAAQKDDAITIRVVDSVNNAPLEYASVKIGCAGIVPVKGSITSSKGECRVERPASCVVVNITISRTGYATRVIEIKDNAPVLAYLSPVVIKQEGVTVTASVVTKEVDKTTFRIRQGDFLTGTKIADMINRVPSLSSAGAEVLIKGRIKADIYLDGKQVSQDILKTLPVDAVKQVEVIENPNATVGGESAGGIVNIILRKDVKNSGGSLSFSKGIARPITLGSGNFMYSDQKLFWLLSASAQTSFQKRSIDVTRKATGTSNEFNQLLNTRGNVLYYNVHSELFFRPDSTRQISASLFHSQMGAETNNFGQFNAYNNNMLNYRLLSANEYDFTNRLYSMLGEYKKQQTKEISYIITGGYQHIPKMIGIENAETNMQNQVKTGNRQNDTAVTDMYSVQAVVSRKDRKRKVQDWENGVYARLEQSADNYSQYTLQPDDKYGVNPDNTGHFAFGKIVAAAYTQLKFTTKKKLQFSTGLRAEYFGFNLGYTDAKNNIRRNFLNLFPSLGVYKSLKKDYNLQLNYSRRIRRPDVTILSQFYYGTSRSQLNTGNSGLLPELTDRVSVSLSKFNKGKYVDFSVYATTKTRPLFERTVKSSVDSSVIRTTGNFNRYNAAGASFTFTLPVKKILTFNGTVYADIFNLTDDEPLLQKHSGVIAGGNLSFTLALKKKLNINGYVSYTSYSFEYQQLTRNNPLGSISAQRSILKDRVTVSLTWMDVFKTGFNRTRDYDDGFVTQTTCEKAMNNNISMGVVYNFGKRLRNNNRQKGLASEEVKERKNND